MNVPTNVQIIRNASGLPAFAIVPWDDYLKSLPQSEPTDDDVYIPNEVVGYMIKEGMSVIAAWRKHLGFSQATVAERIGISQAAYAQQEAAKKPRKVTREKIAQALGIAPELLDV